MISAGSSLSSRQAIDVLIVDDSAVVRQVLLSALSREPDMRVAVASDALVALSKMDRAHFDVVILDLEMPRMHGLAFLEKVMQERPVPVVICSSSASRGAKAALRALELGAVDIVAKPEYGIREFLEESSATLASTVRSAAAARVSGAFTALGGKTKRVLPSLVESPMGSRSPAVVAIGASTGGTEAIRLVLRAMPLDAPGVLVAQHMPEGFTRSFAKNLDRVCRLEVKEVEDGDEILPGRALVARGNRHLILESDGRVRTLDAPRVSGHRPSVDVLFRSMARVVGTRGIGVLLTGMGSDGAEGLLEMRQSGAATLAQDEETSVVFGMPREAVARGAAELVVPLGKMAETILRKARRARPSEETSD